MVFGTCLSTDADHYTTLSETLPPAELSSFLNRYYETLFTPVRQHEGIVSDVVGDSMLAIWAAPQPDAAPRNRACLAALDIFDAVERFNRSSNSHMLPTRIGLHSGQLMLGSIGAVDHYEYRPVGDIVNTVSRIEGLNKYLGTRILASEAVLDRLDGFLARELGKFILAGKTNPVAIYELIGRGEDPGGKHTALCRVFSEALDAYRRRSWQEAIRLFDQSAAIAGQDGPSRFYLKLCERHIKTPPDEPWEGLVRLDRK